MKPNLADVGRDEGRNRIADRTDRNGNRKREEKSEPKGGCGRDRMTFHSHVSPPNAPGFAGYD